MVDLTRDIAPVSIERELQQSYLDYAMSVIVGRALPDVRDGLKPVHRRVLHAMNELNNYWNRPYKKSARVVGDVVGKYHPHGEVAVYNSIVRMAQPFAMRYLLVDGQGNFGSVDGDPPAAMRYTEVRMHKLTHEMLADIDLDTVDYVPNYDGVEQIPTVLPSRLPNLLVNGSTGIAVGMATNIPTHNLRETVAACLQLLDNPEVSIEELMKYIPGPDFPTGGLINGGEGLNQAYLSGRGNIQIRARAAVEEMGAERDRIVVTELPYQVNKAQLISKIADLVKAGSLEGISGLRDESDKQGLCIVIELRRGELGDVMLNKLYAHTQLQISYGINLVALNAFGAPQLFNLKNLLEAFLRHRREVVTRRFHHLLIKARERGHILEGLAVALANVDEVVALIRAARDAEEAREGLMGRSWPAEAVRALLGASEDAEAAALCRPQDLEAEYGLHEDGYHLSPFQARAILELRLHRLTAMEQDSLRAEYGTKIEEIREYQSILASQKRLLQVIREELTELVEEYGDERRSAIRSWSRVWDETDLVPQERRVVTLSHDGYAKSQPLDQYRSQHRGGRGKAAAAVRESDFITTLQVANTHDTLLCFTSLGKLHWLRVYHIPQASSTSRGRPIMNLLPLEKDERITSVLPVQQYDEDHFVFMATASGVVKKTPLMEFSRPRKVGLRAIVLEEGDRLIGTALTDGSCRIMLSSSEGRAIVFDEKDVRATHRSSRGVRGMRIGSGQHLVSLIVVEEKHFALSVSANGYGKRTKMSAFPQRHRGGKGVILMRITERNGNIVNVMQVSREDEVMLISDGGTLARMHCAEIRSQGRSTQGVRLIRLQKGNYLADVAHIAEKLEEEDDA